ncbi:MAG TPA: glycosyltransferase family 2 protein [Candidatus Dormibacteraeota bacterium]|nr:glycosyltransferase family 2 protein [Candidatus Dormibacteraeota bacterium]
MTSRPSSSGALTGKSKPTVDMIIVNRNSGLLLRECLESIVAANWERVDLSRVVVLDDVSTDGSSDGVESLPIPLTLIRNPTYSGYGASCNRGAAESRADYLLFLNADARLFDETVDLAVQFMDSSRGSGVGICGVQLVDEANRVSRSCARFPRARDFIGKSFGLEKLLHLRGMFMTEWDHQDTREVDHVMGAFALIRRVVFTELGGFDERFFVYLEDLDLSLRAAERGWQTAYLAEARAFHKGGATSKRVPATSLFFALRSRLQYAYKHFNWWSATAVLVAALVIEPLTRIVWATTRGSLTDAVATLSATARLAAGLPSALRAHAGRASNES